MNRTIVIFHDKSDMDGNVEKLIEDFTTYGISDKMFVFTASGDKFNKTSNGIATSNVNWPTECDSVPKKRNWINKYLKAQQTTGFVHVISDTVKLSKDPSQFISELECMMKSFDYPLWLNTTTDPCNFLYKKYCPRLVIDVDKEDMKCGYGDKLVFTSHSNDNWIAYDFDNVNEDLLRFDEDFTISMYYIIELLARRKALRKAHQPFFMNQYMTVGSEQKVFEEIPSSIQTSDSGKIQEEDIKFKAKNVPYQSDNSIDEVLERTLESWRSLHS